MGVGGGESEGWVWEGERVKGGCGRGESEGERVKGGCGRGRE